jgi:hypothetical protein
MDNSAFDTSLILFQHPLQSHCLIVILAPERTRGPLNQLVGCMFLANAPCNTGARQGKASASELIGLLQAKGDSSAAHVNLHR